MTTYKVSEVLAQKEGLELRLKRFEALRTMAPVPSKQIAEAIQGLKHDLALVERRLEEAKR